MPSDNEKSVAVCSGNKEPVLIDHSNLVPKFHCSQIITANSKQFCIHELAPDNVIKLGDKVHRDSMTNDDSYNPIVTGFHNQSGIPKKCYGSYLFHRKDQNPISPVDLEIFDKIAITERNCEKVIMKKELKAFGKFLLGGIPLLLFELGFLFCMFAYPSLCAVILMLYFVFSIYGHIFKVDFDSLKLDGFDLP